MKILIAAEGRAQMMIIHMIDEDEMIQMIEEIQMMIILMIDKGQMIDEGVMMVLIAVEEVHPMEGRNIFAA